jgi:lipid-binding SYLF domain-containing protein
MGLKEKDLKTLEQAPIVLETLAEDAPDRGIPQDLLEKAECVLVFPNVTKGAFVVGGEAGRGVATCRVEPDGPMGAPAMFTIGGASIGWQIGGQQTDLVLLVMDRNGMQNLLRDEFKIGAEGSVSAGPVGRTAEASTDELLGAQMLAWSRSQGLFAGVSLEGSVIKPAHEANERLYGRSITAEQIFEQHPSVPPASREFVDVANRLTGEGDQVTQDQAHDADTYARTEPDRANDPAKSAYATDTAQGQSPNASSAYQRDYAPADSSARAAGTGDARNADGSLPSTASPLPLIGLGGIASLLAAWRLRARRNR